MSEPTTKKPRRNDDTPETKTVEAGLPSLGGQALSICLQYWMLPDLGSYYRLMEERLPFLRDEITQYRLRSIETGTDAPDAEVVQSELISENYFPSQYVSQLTSELIAINAQQVFQTAAAMSEVSCG